MLGGSPRAVGTYETAIGGEPTNCGQCPPAVDSSLRAVGWDYVELWDALGDGGGVWRVWAQGRHLSFGKCSMHAKIRVILSASNNCTSGGFSEASARAPAHSARRRPSPTTDTPTTCQPTDRPWNPRPVTRSPNIACSPNTTRGWAAVGLWGARHHQNF